MRLLGERPDLILGALIGIALGNFTVFTSPFFIGAFVDTLSLSAAQAGLIVTLEIGSGATTCLLLSAALARLSLRHMMLAAIVLVLVGNIGSMQVDDTQILAGLRILSGIGAGGGLAVCGALLGRMNDPERAMGIILVLNTLLMVAVLGIMGYTLEQWPLANASAIFAILAAVALPIAWIIPSLPLNVYRPSDWTGQEKDHHLILGSIAVGLLFLLCLMEGSVYSFSERVGKHIGLSNDSVSAILATAQFAGLMGAALAACIGARIPSIYPIGAGGLMTGFGGMMVYITSSPNLFPVYMAVFSLGFFIVFPYLLGACARLDADGRWAARANGVNLYGAALGPVIAGTIIEMGGYRALSISCIGVAVPFLLLALVFVRGLNRVDLHSASEQGLDSREFA